MDELFSDHMLQDPAARAEIVRRCRAGRFPDEPDAPAHDLGWLTLPDGTRTRIWLCHAADAVPLDDLGQTLLIIRRHNPGRGKLALPGGLVDALPGGGMETSRAAALRELVEETGLPPASLAGAKVTQLGHRRFARPFDIRRAWNDLPGTPVREGELFTVSTLPFLVRIPGDLRELSLRAGDDASAVRVVPAARVRQEELAVPDHFDFLREALNV